MDDRLIIPLKWQLPKEITDRFGQKAGRQRIMSHDDHILLIFHAVPSPSTSERKAILFWRSPNGEWKTTERGNGLACLKEHVKSYDDIIDKLDQEFDIAESAEALFKILSSVIPIYRAAKNMHQVLQKVREILHDDKNIITLRDQAYEIERTADLLRNDAKNAIDYSIARRTEVQAKQSEDISLAAHRLNMLVAIFLPITAIASILGTNLRTGLENWGTPIVFWTIMGFGLGIGFALRVFLSKKTNG